MSTVLWRSLAALVLFAGGFAAGGAWTGAAGMGRAEEFPPGGEEGRTRLVLRCKTGRVPHVLTALAQEPVEVWNATTREALRVDAPTHAPAATATATPSTAPLRTLPDATVILTAIYAALGTPEGPLATLQECTIQERRAVITVELDDAALSTRIRQALAASPALRARGTRVESGTMVALDAKGKRMRTKYALRFDTNKPNRAATPIHAGTLSETIWKAAAKAGVSIIWAGAMQQDPRTGPETILSREYRLTNETVARMQAFLAAITGLDPSLTVFEVRWKVMNPGRTQGEGVIMKPTVRVGGRSRR